MALQLPTMTPIGLMAEQAYHVIENVRLISRTTMVFDHKAYVTGERNEEGRRVWPAFRSRTYTIEIDPTRDVWPQGYAYMKALPELDGAVDV